jgi:hypothetical protein
MKALLVFEGYPLGAPAVLKIQKARLVAVLPYCRWYAASGCVQLKFSMCSPQASQRCAALTATLM